MTKNEMKILIDNAIKKGKEAGFNIEPLSDKDAHNDKKTGYAWIIIKPKKNNSEHECFIKYLLEQNIVENDHVYGGVRYLITEFNNSYNRRNAFGRAFAYCLMEAGLFSVSMFR